MKLGKEKHKVVDYFSCNKLNNKSTHPLHEEYFNNFKQKKVTFKKK